MGDKRHNRSAIEILGAAKAAEEQDLPALSISLARAVLSEALDVESREEKSHKHSLGEVLYSERSQIFSLALTDRVHRSSVPETTIDAIVELARNIGVGAWLPPLDRAQLRVLTMFGRAVPDITVQALEARLRAEASPFVLDATPYELSARLHAIKSNGAQVNLNYLGEEVLGERQAERHMSDTIALMNRPDIDAFSLKLSNVYSQLDLLAFEDTVQTVVDRLVPVFEKAMAHDKLLYFDMEAYRDLELTYAVFERLLARPDLASAKAGLAVQAYLPDSLGLVRRVVELAKKRVASGGAPVRLRLVKGANLAMERVEASQHRWAVPIYPNKEAVDANYKRLLAALIVSEHSPYLRLGVGSHNLFDLCYSLLLRERRNARQLVQLEMLEGMAGSMGRVLGNLAGGMLLYAPAVLPENFPAAISYLVRRLDENTGPDNFLRLGYQMRPGDSAFHAESERFLAALDQSRKPSVSSYRARQTGEGGHVVSRNVAEWSFDNEPDTDFTQQKCRDSILAGVRQACAEQPEFGARVGGREVTGTPTIGRDPSVPGAEAYRYFRAGPETIEEALATAWRVRLEWSAVPAKRRALLVDRVADELAKRRGQLIGAMVKDGGKRIYECDVEVSEAIDFARYYAHSLVKLEDCFELSARGPVVVTPPWNFPLAIPLGGCLAALLAGNPVILKPAPETPLVARAACEACWDAGIPPEVLQFLPCDDADASPLIEDPRIDTVVLTGATSTAKKFMHMRPGLRLLAETGGKNGVYVSPLSDREQAIRHIVHSAFGHSGQKCSALSMLVLHQEVHRDDSFRQMLVDATESLVVGSAHDPRSFVTPLIRAPEGPLHRILNTLEDDERWLVRPETSVHNPQLTSPGIVWNVRPGSFAHQTEFFGPILAVLEARDLEHGLELLNDTPYGLTAGFFGLREGEQERFAEGMNAGNLYINRGITGAVVGRQPFGGRKASNFGPGAKAGGPGYVAQFCRLGAAKRQTWSLARTSTAELPTLAQVMPNEQGTEVMGEENFLRYQPVATAIVVFADAALDDVKRAETAQKLSGGPPLRFDHHGDHTVPELLNAIATQACNRVRTVGTPGEKFVSAAATRDIVLLSDPVSDDPRAEIALFVKEQTISFAYHRYGNLSLRGLSRLTEDAKMNTENPD